MKTVNEIGMKTDEGFEGPYPIGTSAKYVEYTTEEGKTNLQVIIKEMQSQMQNAVIEWTDIGV